MLQWCRPVVLKWLSGIRPPTSTLPANQWSTDPTGRYFARQSGRLRILALVSVAYARILGEIGPFKSTFQQPVPGCETLPRLVAWRLAVTVSIKSEASRKDPDGKSLNILERKIQNQRAVSKLLTYTVNGLNSPLPLFLPLVHFTSPHRRGESYRRIMSSRFLSIQRCLDMARVSRCAGHIFMAAPRHHRTQPQASSHER